jgi:menaquinone-dependent protoporphyrinogen oxidase
MSNKILVTYASRSGSTAGVAEAIAKTLAESGEQVDLCPMQDVGDITQYRAVIAGSAIRGGKWLPEAMQFMRVHQSELAQKPFAAFLVCITLAMHNGEKYRDGVGTWLSPVRKLVRPVREGLFAGSLNFREMPFTFGKLRMQLAAALGIFPKGDHRDWTAIRAWALALKPVLTN